MTQAEKQHLNELIAELVQVQEYAPTKTTYSMGRTESSISYRLLSIISRLKDMVGDTETVEDK